MSREYITSNDVIKIVRKLGFSGNEQLYYKDKADKNNEKAYQYCYTQNAIINWLIKHVSYIRVKAIIQEDNCDYNQYPIKEVWEKFFLPREELIKVLKARKIFYYTDIPEDYFFKLNYPDDHDLLFK